MNGKVLFSKKTHVEPNVDPIHWARLGYNDFMPSKAWIVPVEGNIDALPVKNVESWIQKMEQANDPSNMIGVHVELIPGQKGGDSYLLITIGCYAT